MNQDTDRFDPGVNSWDPPESSVGLFKMFASLDEMRETEWTVDEKGELICILHEPPRKESK